jgi:acyl-CoA dehydrogenase
MTANVSALILPSPSDLKLRDDPVAQIAAAHADTVDREARFPAEAMRAIRAERLLSLFVPAALGALDWPRHLGRV